MGDVTSNELHVLKGLLRYQNWEACSELIELDPQSIPDVTMRQALRVIDEYHRKGLGGAEEDMTVEDLSHLMPVSSLTEHLIEKLRATRDPAPGVVSKILQNFMRESGLRKVAGHLALYQKHKGQLRDDKAADDYLEVTNAANQLIELEDRLTSNDRVLPTSVRDNLHHIEQDSTRHLSFGFAPVLDAHMSGGIPVGEIGAIMAPLGVGKSLVLCNIGAALMAQGHDVIHVTLEMRAPRLTRWYASILSGIPHSDLAERHQEVEAATNPDWGDCYIHDYSGHYCSVATIENVVRRSVHGVAGRTRPAALLVDYLALCDRSKDDLYLALGNDARRLRKLASRYNLAVVTAIQANRKAMEGDAPRTEKHHAADSIELPRVMDWLLTLSQTHVEKLASRLRVLLDKNRYGAENVEMDFQVRYPCLQVLEPGTTFWSDRRNRG